MLRISSVAFILVALLACDRSEPVEANEPAISETGGDEWPVSSVVSGEVARGLVERGARLIDVRSPEEFGDGSIEGATNIPVGELPARLDELESGVPVIVYCRSGRRSANAAETLTSASFEHVYDLGGMSNW